MNRDDDNFKKSSGNLYHSGKHKPSAAKNKGFADILQGIKNFNKAMISPKNERDREGRKREVMYEIIDCNIEERGTGRGSA